MTPTIIDLKPFCDTEPSLYSLEEPWRVGDVVYATDGRILIEVDAALAELVAEAGGRKVPTDIANRIFKRFSKATDWRACPEVKGDCEQCGNTGRAICFDCGHTHTCHECKTSGRGDACCEACLIEIGGELFQAKYLRLVAALPAVQCANDPAEKCRLYFRFDGGRGALIAIRKE